MQREYNKVKNKLSSILTSVSSILILFLQYVPCTAIWFGIMSVPLISYFVFFFQNPSILIYDLRFLIGTQGFYLVVFGVIFYAYSLIYQLSHRGHLNTKGPYKYLRHPQYLAFIILTLGMTIVAFQTSPIFEFPVSYENQLSMLFIIWLVEVAAYIVLGKIEEFALKAKYGDKFLEYRSSVAFIVPFLKIRSNKTEKG